MTAESEKCISSLINDSHRNVQDLQYANKHLSVEYRGAVRQYLHSSTDWSLFHGLLPWIANFRVESDHYRALLRYQLLLRSRKSVAVGAMMECNCRNKNQPPRAYTDPDYHSWSCAYAALIRKRTHDHIVKKTTAFVNQLGKYRATEPDEPEANGTGVIPDVYLVRNPASPPSGADQPQPESIDVSITQLVHSNDYRCNPASLVKEKRNRPMDERYDEKRQKHGPTSVPLVFDHAANIHGLSLKFLVNAADDSTADTAVSAKPSLMFFRKECAAAICRMIGSMYARNIVQRTQHITPLPDAELSEAMAMYAAEYATDQWDASETTVPANDHQLSVPPSSPTPSAPCSLVLPILHPATEQALSPDSSLQ